MKPKPNNKQLNRIDFQIESRRRFRIWWGELVRTIPGYGSPEHECIAWAAWDAGTNQNKATK
jgi:hypothetical protein